MGALHEGHLIRARSEKNVRCRGGFRCLLIRRNSLVQVKTSNTITRFNERHGAANGLQRRLHLCATTVEEIYPRGFSTFVNVEGLSEQLEGASPATPRRRDSRDDSPNTVRPGLRFLRTERCAAGARDSTAVRDLAIDTEIVILPIVRERHRTGDLVA